MEQDVLKKQRLQYYSKILKKSPEYYEAYQDYLKQKPEIELSENLYRMVLIPVLMEYIKWVLNEAIISGKKRLYFLARDGYQMYLAAKRICEELSLPVECRYLYVSRYAVRLPEFHILQEQCLERICIGGIDVTFQKIMKRAALTEEEGTEIAVRTGYMSKYHRKMNYQEIIKLKEQLRKEPQFFSYVYQHSKETYSETIAYFEQEGLLEDIPYALVDSGWVGTMQQSVSNLINEERKREGSGKLNYPVEGYYFGLYELPKNCAKEHYHFFYFGPHGKMRRKVYFSNNLFETIFSAPEEMTLGYVYKNGVYKPVLDKTENMNKKRLIKDSKQLECYLEYYFYKNSNNRELHSNAELVESLLTIFMGKPTVLELEAYGANYFSDDVLENDMRKVSAELTEKEIANQHFWNKVLIMLGIKKQTIHESAWIEGSIVQNGKYVKKNLRHAAWYKYFVYIRKELKGLKVDRHDIRKK